MQVHLPVRPLFCKPVDPGFVYPKAPASSGTALSFRSLSLNDDLDLLHRWVNMDYTRSFWQMRGSIGLLRACYQCILQNPYAHSFIGYRGKTPVCQVDLYSVAHDELSDHVEAGPEDCGFHLLMAPVSEPVPGLTVALVRAFLDFYFSHPEARRLFAEPDVLNEKSIRLLERAGFEKRDTVQMSYKQAHVYCLSRDKYYEIARCARNDGEGAI